MLSGRVQSRLWLSRFRPLRRMVSQSPREAEITDYRRTK